MDIQADAQEAITALYTANADGVLLDVNVLRGQVTLTGYMRSEMIGPAIEHAVRAVDGTRGVVNHLVDDSSLVRCLATALSSDARTQAIPPGYQVMSSFGRVMVVGALTEQMAAHQVCAGVSGVRSVEIKSIGAPSPTD
jgi:osmotically-inducible protein OsmY